MKQGWQKESFSSCIEKVVCKNKIQRKLFLDQGLFSIVSQERELINGYWDTNNDVIKTDTPVIVFGDHTKVLKYIDFDFVIGADGVKVLKPKKFIVPKFFYYQLKSISIDSLGYSRHYKLLRDLQISFPDSIAEQKRIVALLDQAFEAIDISIENAKKTFKMPVNFFKAI